MIRTALILAVMLLALTGTVTARAQDDGAITVADFHTIIAEGIWEIDSAEDANDLQQSLYDLQNRLDAIDSILLENGEIIHPDFTFIDPDEPDATLPRLRLLDSQLTLADNDNTEARMARLEETLQSLGMKKLSEVTPRPLKPKSDSTAALTTIGEALKWIVMLAGGILLIYVLGSWLSKMLGGVVADAELKQQEANNSRQVTSRQAREKATDMARAGNYREAVRHLYLSALFKLEETGAVPRDRSKTNHELLAAVTGNGKIRRHLQPVVETFDRVWYGVKEPDDATFHQYEQEIDELNQTLSNRRADLSPPDSEDRQP